MWLDEISETTVLVESDDQSWGRKLYFAYQKAKEMSKPDPIVFYLGLWRMTDKQGKRKKFLCGINLAALSNKKELAALQEHLPDILEPTNVKDRYSIGSKLLPHIFRKAYRTYNVKNIVSRALFGRLRALKTTDQDVEQAKREALKDSRPDWPALSKDEQEKEYQTSANKVWDKLPSNKKDQYLEKEISKRGEKDLERIEQAQEERNELEDYYHELQTKKELDELEDEEDTDFEDEITSIPYLEPEVEYPAYTRKKAIPPSTPQPKKMQPITPGPGYDMVSDQVGLPTAKSAEPEEVPDEPMPK